MKRSNRFQGAFVAVNCGALPETLVHSELFGYEKGAFTGANMLKIGHIEAANGGTLFLDEIGDRFPWNSKSTFYVFLQEHQVRRLGGSPTIYQLTSGLLLQPMLILDQAITEGRFREDLFVPTKCTATHTTTTERKAGRY